MSISDLIGEATTYDKKLSLERKEPLSWLKSMSAFANTLGGQLIFGVSDNGECVGLEQPEKDAEDLSEIIKNSLDPVPQFDLSFHKEEDKTFVIVSVSPGTATPYYVLLKGHRDAYIRIGNESVKAGSIDLKRLVLKGSQRDWDSLPSGYKRTTFAFETLRAEYFARTSLEFADGDFESFGLVMPDGTLTNAGALLADKSPVRHSRVFCTRWNGIFWGQAPKRLLVNVVMRRFCGDSACATVLPRFTLLGEIRGSVPMKSRSNRLMGKLSSDAAMFVQAMRALGQDHVNSDIIERLSKRFSKVQADDIEIETRIAPDWIHAKAVELKELYHA